MSDEDWSAGFAKSLGVFLNGRAIPSPNERGEPVVDDSFYLMFNAHHEPLEFTLADSKWAERWIVVLNTAEDKDLLSEQDTGPEIGAGSKLQVQAWSVVLFRGVSPS
jgi:glycogen operon protein